MQELSQEQLLELVKSLSTRLDAVESELAELKARSDSEISEDVLLGCAGSPGRAGPNPSLVEDRRKSHET